MKIHIVKTHSFLKKKEKKKELEMKKLLAPRYLPVEIRINCTVKFAACRK